LLCHFNSIVDLNAEVANGALELCTSERQLHRAEVLRFRRSRRPLEWRNRASKPTRNQHSDAYQYAGGGPVTIAAAWRHTKRRCGFNVD
jgi:hypothetical protein